MKDEKNKIYAVFTGDVVNSSSLATGKRNDLLERLRNTYRVIKDKYPADYPYELDIFSGDSWQFVSSDPVTCLRIALLFRTYFRGYMPSLKLDTRISIGIGKISSLNPERISQSDGEAFRLSGRALNELSNNCYMKFSSGDLVLTQAINSQLILLDLLTSSWTEKQSLSIAGSLLGLRQKEIGELWENPIKQQSVANFLEKAGWKKIDTSLSFIENVLKSSKN